MSEYWVVIEQDGETARLDCETYEEARLVKIAFENYGRFQSIKIEENQNA